MIEFDSPDVPGYGESLRSNLEHIKSVSEEALEEFGNYEGISSYHLDKMRTSVINMEVLNAKING